MVSGEESLTLRAVATQNGDVRDAVEQKAWMAELHVPRKGKESSWFNIVDLRRHAFDYEKCVVCTCHNLDMAEAFIIEKEKERETQGS